MKILLWIVIVIAVLVGIILIIPAFISPEASITKSINVNKPIDFVFNVAKDFDHYREWNVWSKMEKDLETSIEGTPGEIGSKWTWAGDTIGTGSLTLKDFVMNQSIKNELEFIEPPFGKAEDLWTFEMIDSSSTKINWTYHVNMESYFMRYFNLGLESQLGPQLEQGLQNFKEYVEAMPDEELIKNTEPIEEEI